MAWGSPLVLRLRVLESYMHAGWVGGGSLQKGVFNVLSVPPRDPWPPLINSKMQVFGIDDCVSSQNDYVESIPVLKGRPASVKTCLLRTIMTSWSTSYRLSASVLLPCLSGCMECEDTLKHYLCCDPFWTLAICACRLPSSFLLRPPIDRICSLNRSIYGLKLFRLVYGVCHIANWDMGTLAITALPLESLRLSMGYPSHL